MHLSPAWPLLPQAAEGPFCSSLRGCCFGCLPPPAFGSWLKALTTESGCVSVPQSSRNIASLIELVVLIFSRFASSHLLCLLVSTGIVTVPNECRDMVEILDTSDVCFVVECLPEEPVGFAPRCVGFQGGVHRDDTHSLMHATLSWLLARWPGYGALCLGCGVEEHRLREMKGQFLLFGGFEILIFHHLFHSMKKMVTIFCMRKINYSAEICDFRCVSVWRCVVPLVPPFIRTNSSKYVFNLQAIANASTRPSFPSCQTYAMILTCWTMS